MTKTSNLKLQTSPEASGTERKRILIAGIGNIFMGDDAFGCEMVRALLDRLPAGQAEIRDFGIRSYDLAYALIEDYQVIILVDAVSRGAAAGTVFLIEPETNDLVQTQEEADAHSMNPVAVIQMARRLGGIKGRIYLVGCEPKTLVAGESEMGLSEEVQAAVPRAIGMIEQLIQDLREEETLTNAGMTPV